MVRKITSAVLLQQCAQVEAEITELVVGIENKSHGERIELSGMRETLRQLQGAYQEMLEIEQDEAPAVAA